MKRHSFMAAAQLIDYYYSAKGYEVNCQLQVLS